MKNKKMLVDEKQVSYGRFGKTRYFESLIEVKKIVNVSRGCDYFVKSNFLHPIVVFKDGTYNCIENWHIVVQQKDVEVKILCCVIESDYDDCGMIRKLQLHIFPEIRGGQYSKICFLISQAVKDLTAAGYTFNSWGGNGGDVKNQMDGVNFIASRLGIVRKTVLSYKKNGDRINNQLFALLLKERLSKVFFEKFNQLRSKLDGFVRSAEFDDLKIDRLIHLMAVQLLMDYKIFQKSDIKKWSDTYRADIIINHFNPQYQPGNNDLAEDVDDSQSLTIIDDLICNNEDVEEATDSENKIINQDEMVEFVDDIFNCSLDKIRQGSCSKNEIMSVISDLVKEILSKL